MALDAIGIICKDIQKTIEFYEILGVNFNELGEGHFEATTVSGVRLMLDSIELIRKINPDWERPTGSGIVLCFKQESPEAVDQLYAKVTDAGFVSVKEPWDAFWGQRYSSVQDPNGNQIDIFAAL